MKGYILLVLVLTAFELGQVKAIADIQNRPSSASMDRVENLAELELFDCLNGKGLVSPIPEDDESSSGWYPKLADSLESSFYRPAQYRRHLANENGVASDSDIASDKQHNINVAIIIAVVVTATVTFIFALLLFICCHERLGIKIDNYYKDDKPLGIRTGSKNPAAFQSSYHQMSFQTCCSSIGDKEHEENLESAVVNKSVDRVDTLPIKEPLDIDPKIPSPPLKPPPGRVPLPPESPPLKPLPKPPPPPPCPCAPAPPPPSPRRPPSSGGGPPPPPPPAGGNKPGVRPAPPLKGVVQPPSAPNAGTKGGTNTSSTKLKPFFWDKVLTNPGHKMVWNHIKAGSFEFNEEMIETLFGYPPPDKTKLAPNKNSSTHDAPKFIQLIDPKKAQNLSILMRALNITTEEVCDALEQGNELPTELLETLLKMAPTPEEELKLRLFSGELSQLGPAERFLKVLVDIPFAFQRMQSLHFMCTLEDEVRNIKESFLTLEAACNELRDSRLFLKLLEAVLKTGNRMNDGTFRGGAQAFKLDTLLKLSDVKGVDGKTTLLHFVVVEIIRSEGIRASRQNGFTEDNSEDDSDKKMCNLGLQVVSGLSGELEGVKKAAGLDGEVLSSSVARLGNSIAKTRNFLNSEMKNIDDKNGFHQVLKCFIEEVDDAVMQLAEEEKMIAELVKSTADYFHGKPGKEEGLRLFTIVRDFLVILEKACAQVAEHYKKSNHDVRHKKDLSSSKQNSTDTPLQLPPDVRQRFMKATANTRVGGDSSSDDEDD